MPIQNGDKVFGIDCGLWVKGVYSRQNKDGTHRIKVGRNVVNSEYVEPQDPQAIRLRERETKKNEREKWDELSELYGN